jgi:hypothetical protein
MWKNILGDLTTSIVRSRESASSRSLDVEEYIR